MSKVTKLRFIGGAILFVLLWVVGAYDIQGPTNLILLFGFAIGYELLVVKPAKKAEPPKQPDGQS